MQACGSTPTNILAFQTQGLRYVSFELLWKREIGDFVKLRVLLSLQKMECQASRIAVLNGPAMNTHILVIAMGEPSAKSRVSCNSLSRLQNNTNCFHGVNSISKAAKALVRAHPTSVGIDEKKNYHRGTLIKVITVIVPAPRLSR